MARRKSHNKGKRQNRTVKSALLTLLIIFIVTGVNQVLKYLVKDDTPTILDSMMGTTSEATPEPSEFDNSTTDSNASTVSGGNLIAHFIDVGQADSILLESNGEFMLVDAGNNADKDTVINYLKEQGVDELKYVVATHPHEDHIGAMDEVIAAFPVGEIFAPYVEHTSKTYYNLLEQVTLADLKMVQPKVGSEVTLGGCTVTFLSPNVDYKDDLNNWSVGLKITNGIHTFVMCGDAENEAEADILANGIDIKADVLKLGHHGSSTSNSDAFLAAVEPKYAVISCGVDNSYGHPHTETIQKINNLGIQLFRTDEQGTIIAASDGESITWNVKPVNGQ